MTRPSEHSPRERAGPLRRVVDAIRGALPPWTRHLPAALGIIVLGAVIGQQYWSPNKRVLPLIAAALVAGIAWRLDLVTSIGMLLFLLPYPKSNIFGNTNLALAALIGLMWLVNASLRRAPPPRSSPIDLPLAGLVIVYICSFYNVRSAEAMAEAIPNFELFIGCVLVYYILIANVNTTRALQRIHLFQMFCAFSVFLLGLYELSHPTARIVPGWIDFSNGLKEEISEGIAVKGVRIGSSFRDYELLSEFCVLTMLQAIFLLARARTATQRTLFGSFLGINLFILFATVTRGAIVSLGVGLLVMIWHVRRKLRFVPAVVGLTAGLLLFAGMNFFVGHFTNSGDMFERLSKTQFQGFVPDTRVTVWSGAWNRAWTHPFVGQGPFYASIFGYGKMWPHNIYLYYANIVGFIGLGFFLWILGVFVRLTRPTVDSLRHPDYARAAQIVTRAQLIAFMVNEFKIDYLRNSIYQTVVWAMFSVWTATYLVARQPTPARLEEVPTARAA